MDTESAPPKSRMVAKKSAAAAAPEAPVVKRRRGRPRRRQMNEEIPVESSAKDAAASEKDGEEEAVDYGDDTTELNGKDFERAAKAIEANPDRSYHEYAQLLLTLESKISFPTFNNFRNSLRHKKQKNISGRSFRRVTLALEKLADMSRYSTNVPLAELNAPARGRPTGAAAATQRKWARRKPTHFLTTESARYLRSEEQLSDADLVRAERVFHTLTAHIPLLQELAKRMWSVDPLINYNKLSKFRSILHHRQTGINTLAKRTFRRIVLALEEFEKRVSPLPSVPGAASSAPVVVGAKRRRNGSTPNAAAGGDGPGEDEVDEEEIDVGNASGARPPPRKKLRAPPLLRSTSGTDGRRIMSSSGQSLPSPAARLSALSGVAGLELAGNDGSASSPLPSLAGPVTRTSAAAAASTRSRDQSPATVMTLSSARFGLLRQGVVSLLASQAELPIGDVVNALVEPPFGLSLIEIELGLRQMTELKEVYRPEGERTLFRMKVLQ